MIWLLLFVFVIIWGLLGDSRLNNKSYKIFRILLVLTISFLPGIGSLIAEDHLSYASYYKSFNISDSLVSLSEIGNSKETIEFGYIFLNYLGHFLFLDIPGFFFLVSCIINTFIVIVAYRFPFPVLSIFLFIISPYYFQEANLVRQSISISIFLFSLKYLQNNNYLKYFFCIILATSFHSSSFMLVALIPLAYFISSEQNYLKFEKVLLFLWLGSFLIQLGVISFNVFQFFPSVGPFSDMYSSYMYSDSEVGIVAQADKFYLFNCVISVIIAFLLRSNSNNIYTAVYILGAIFTNISFVYPGAYRFGLYFTFLSPLYITFLLNRNNKYFLIKYRFIHCIFCMVMSLYFYTYVKNFLFLTPILGTKLYPLSNFFVK